jgi:acetyl-CoA synthetase
MSIQGGRKRTGWQWIKPFTKVKNTTFETAMSRSSGSRTARLNVSYNCIDRPSRRQARRSGRDHLGRRRARPTTRRSPTKSCTSEVCRWANVLKCAGRQEGRPRHHLHADDSRSGLRHAGLRAYRRDPLGRVRRLLAGQRLQAASRTATASIVITADEGIRARRQDRPLKKPTPTRR